MGAPEFYLPKNKNVPLDSLSIFVLWFCACVRSNTKSQITLNMIKLPSVHFASFVIFKLLPVN